MISVPHSFPNPPAQTVAAGRQPVAGATAWTRGKLSAPALLRFWHLTSLDAPTVAATWTMAFAWTAGVRLPLWVPLLVALGAWIVYAGDRLLDARRALRSGRMEDLRERHFFHWRHRRILAPLVAAAAVAAAGMVAALMPVASRERGSVLALAALAYFTRVHLPEGSWPRIGRRPARFVRKELLVGLLFTVACALPGWNRAPSRPWILVASTAFFSAIAWLNCHAIDRWESTSAEGRQAQIEFAAVSLALGGSLAAALVSASYPRTGALLLAGAVSAFLLALLDRLRSRLTPLALRAAADLVLLTPLVLLVR